MAPRAAFFYDYPAIDGDVFGKGRREHIADLTELYPHVVHAGNFDEHAAYLGDIEVIFATWGMFRFEDRHFAAMPKLKAVFYAAGNVKAFAEPLVQNGVVLVSAWSANAIPTSEMVLAQVLLSLRGYFRAVRGYKATKSFEGKVFDRRGINGETVGLLGLGKIATRVRSQLAAYPVKVIVYDPFLTPERAAKLDVESVSMDEVFRRALVVSNHIPDIPDTRGVLTAAQFEVMRDGATFINSGRGAQVVEADLLAMLEARPDVTVLTDVTWPEPPAPDSAFWTLPNVVMSPHIGGTVGDEVVRLADLVIEEYQRWARGEPLQHQVTAEVLATMG